MQYAENNIGNAQYAFLADHNPYGCSPPPYVYRTYENPQYGANGELGPDGYPPCVLLVPPEFLSKPERTEFLPKSEPPEFLTRSESAEFLTRSESPGSMPEIVWIPIPRYLVPMYPRAHQNMFPPPHEMSCTYGEGPGDSAQFGMDPVQRHDNCSSYAWESDASSSTGEPRATSTTIHEHKSLESDTKPFFPSVMMEVGRRNDHESDKRGSELCDPKKQKKNGSEGDHIVAKGANVKKYDEKETRGGRSKHQVPATQKASQGHRRASGKPGGGYRTTQESRYQKKGPSVPVMDKVNFPPLPGATLVS